MGGHIFPHYYFYLCFFFKAVEKIPYIIGSTQTADALETLRKEGFTNRRPGVPTLAVVITDGLSRYPSLTKVRAALLRDMGVLMYAIGMFNQVCHLNASLSNLCIWETPK